MKFINKANDNRMMHQYYEENIKNIVIKKRNNISIYTHLEKRAKKDIFQYSKRDRLIIIGDFRFDH